MISSTNGNSCDSSTQPSAAVPSFERNRASAYDAGMATRTVSTAEASDTWRLLSAARPSSCSVKAWTKFCVVGFVGMRLGCSCTSSRGGLNAVERSQTSGNPRKIR